MKNKIGFLSILIMLSLVLAACAGADTGNVSNLEQDQTFGESQPGAIATADAQTTALPNTGLGSGASATMFPTDENTLPNTGASGAGTGVPAVETPGVGMGTEGPAVSGMATESPQVTTAAGPQSPQGTSAPGQDQQPQFAAVIEPADQRVQATFLSNLMNYQVQDSSGAPIGVVSDYVINLCESHIIYMVVDADPGLNLENGNRLLIPFEILTLKDGVIDVNQQAYRLNVDTASIQGAPAVGDTLDLNTLDWEADVQGFWSNIQRLTLTSECTIPGSGEDGPVTIQHNLLASELLNTQLQTGNGQGLGQVEEALIEPESGQLQFVVVRTDNGLTPVPVRAVNINREETTGETPLPLILLVEPEVLTNAPHFEAIPETEVNDWEAATRDYWSQEVQMQGLP